VLDLESYADGTSSVEVPQSSATGIPTGLVATTGTLAVGADDVASPGLSLQGTADEVRLFQGALSTLDDTLSDDLFTWMFTLPPAAVVC
jgi:hypothetical protein